MVVVILLLTSLNNNSLPYQSVAHSLLTHYKMLLFIKMRQWIFQPIKNTRYDAHFLWLVVIVLPMYSYCVCFKLMKWLTAVLWPQKESVVELEPWAKSDLVIDKVHHLEFESSLEGASTRSPLFCCCCHFQCAVGHRSGFSSIVAAIVTSTASLRMHEKKRSMQCDRIEVDRENMFCTHVKWSQWKFLLSIDLHRVCTWNN